ncbi:MAG: ABC transporter permease [Candidatus Aminicenantes bacterium]|nr:ABC transporter permease [Candidatus Aminicenantes bacterium]
MTKLFRPPPRLFVWMKNRMSCYDEDFIWSGDLEEEFREKEVSEGRKKANLWFALQVVKSIFPYIHYIFYWSLFMFKNYIVTAFRNIRRQKGFSFLNLAGLSVGITCVILLSLYIQEELSYDRFHKDYDRIYRVCMEHPFVYNGKNQSAITPAPLAPALKEDLPEVSSSLRMVDWINVHISVNDTNFLEESLLFASPGFFDVFSFELVKGNPRQVLADPYSVVLSQRMAQKYFGSENPLGKTVKFEDRFDLQVTGIIRNMPENSHFNADLISPFQLFGISENEDFTSWGASGYYTYLKLKEEVSPAQVEDKLKVYMERGFRPGQSREGFKYFLQPLKKIHLHSNLVGEIGPNNDIKNILIFGFIAFLILIIACINYMNLVTARSAKRGKEVGIRKVVGAKKSQIVKQFFGESILLAFLALLISCFLAKALLPVFNDFVGRDLRFSPVSNPWLLALLGGILMFIGLFAGSYPAFVLSSFRPTAILKGVLVKKGKGLSLRNGLVVVQFGISIVLITCTLVVKSQLNFIKNADVGYTRDQVVTMNLRDPEIQRRLPVIKEEFLNNPSILAVSSSSNLPHRITSLRRAKSPESGDEDYFPIYELTVDYDFIDLFAIEMVEGRNFSREFLSDADEGFILNEAAVRALGYADPLNREFIYPIHGGSLGRGRIIGVMKDFNMLSLHQGIEPLYLRLDPEQSQRYLSVKISEDNIPETLAFIEDKFDSLSSAYPVEFLFFDDVFFREYQNEQKMGKMFDAFGLLAVFIACLGLFGLASFATESRIKEIGIRKVLGASSGGIVVHLSKEFVKWVMASNLLAWPIAFYIMNRWLQGFAYRVPLGFGLFLLSASIALGLALLTVFYQVSKAAHADPVHALKYE